MDDQEKLDLGRDIFDASMANIMREKEDTELARLRAENEDLKDRAIKAEGELRQAHDSAEKLDWAAVHRERQFRSQLAAARAHLRAINAAFNPAGLEVPMPERLGGEQLLDLLCAIESVLVGENPEEHYGEWWDDLNAARERIAELERLGSIECPDDPGDPCGVCGADKATGVCGAGNPLALEKANRIADLERQLEGAAGEKVSDEIDAALAKLETTGDPES